MKLDFDKHRDVWGPLFTEYLQTWGKHVFEPALTQIEDGIMVLPKSGDLPEGLVIQNDMEHISKSGIDFNLLESTPKEKDILYFDMAADEYQMAVKPFKAPINYRVFKILNSLISSKAKILDCACGPGYESIALSQIAFDGEVIGIDLSKEMVMQSYKNARNHEISNVGFYQCDAAKIPYNWDEHFDLIFCQLSCSYFKNIKEVIKEHSRLLHSKGTVALVEPLPNLNHTLSTDMHKAAVPLFNRVYDQDTIMEWYKAVGFNSFYWEEILPGIVMYIFTK